MSIFDLLFVLVFLATVVSLGVVVFFAVSGRGARALKILRISGIGLGIYLGVAILVSLMLPIRVFRVGDPQCSDDWCIAVKSVDRARAGSDLSYNVTLRLFSRAGRRAQREKGLHVYLTDDLHRRYDPVPDSSDVPLDVLLQPLQSIETERVFKVPADARDIGLVIGRESGFSMGMLILGRGPFKRTIVKLD